jgi:hypothetical protein
LQHFQLAENLCRTLHTGLVFQVVPQIFFGQHDDPDQLAERDLLLGATRPDFAVALLDIELAFAQKPVAQVAVNLVDAPLQVLRRDLGIVLGQFRLLNSLEKPGSESVRVGFDQTDEFGRPAS